jgi:hypothetical protein
MIKGASVETLLRRVGYKNRKGRSAARRLDKIFPKWGLTVRQLGFDRKWIESFDEAMGR